MPEPDVPYGLTGRELDPSIREELMTLSHDTAERVGKHLVAAMFALEDGEIESATAHSAFAVRLAGRVAAVRETRGVVAYEADDYTTALQEFRAARRISGSAALLPLIADCERGLGRPEKALETAALPETAELTDDETVELKIVVAGAKADLGDLDGALAELEIPELRHKSDGHWNVRLWVAYSDLLGAAGRHMDAAKWLTLAADADTEGLTDAGERLGRPLPDISSLPWEDDERIEIFDAYDEHADDPEELPDEALDDAAEQTDLSDAMDDAPLPDSGTDEASELSSERTIDAVLDPSNPDPAADPASDDAEPGAFEARSADDADSAPARAEAGQADDAARGDDLQESTGFAGAESDDASGTADAFIGDDAEDTSDEEDADDGREGYSRADPDDAVADVELPGFDDDDDFYDPDRPLSDGSPLGGPQTDDDRSVDDQAVDDQAVDDQAVDDRAPMDRTDADETEEN